MHRSFPAVCLVVALGTAGALARAGAAPTAPRIAWQHDYRSTLALAARTHRDVIVDFYTDWCAECRVLDSLTFRDPAIVAYSSAHLWVKVNAERDTSASRPFHLMGYPTSVVLASDGTERDRIMGYVPPEEFRRTVEDYRAGRNTLATLLRDEPAHAADYPYLYRLGERLLGHGRTDEAMRRMARVWQGDTSGADEAVHAGFWIAKTMARSDRADSARALFHAILDRSHAPIVRANVLPQLGLVCQRSGRPREAIDAFQTFLDEFPDDANASEIRGMVAKLREVKTP